MDETKEKFRAEPTYWALEYEVSIGFNRMKAKIFNLIEASVPDKAQSEALKGLIRGFANDEYRSTIENMRYVANLAKLIPEGEGQTILPPIGAEPLESR